MTWLEHHRESERLAYDAELHTHRGEAEQSKGAYRQAAAAEERALNDLDRSKQRTYGITAVSAAALYFKGGLLREAESLACAHLGTKNIPGFAQVQLRDILQMIWSELAREATGTAFEPHKIDFSLRGDHILHGTAPLDLVLALTQRTESLIYRVAELMHHMPHRNRGRPSRAITESHQPWLVQKEPGSYQFAVALREPMQRDMFKLNDPGPGEIVAKSLSILRAGVYSPTNTLPDLVPDGTYRNTFLKLARDLSPNGRRFNRLEIRSHDAERDIILTENTRYALTDAIRGIAEADTGDAAAEEELTGILRAVDLEHDWLDVLVGEARVRVHGVGDPVDDLIGPLVNHRVIVTAERDSKDRLRFVDIEPDD